MGTEDVLSQSTIHGETDGRTPSTYNKAQMLVNMIYDITSAISNSVALIVDKDRVSRTSDGRTMRLTVEVFLFATFLATSAL